MKLTFCEGMLANTSSMATSKLVLGSQSIMAILPMAKPT